MTGARSRISKTFSSSKRALRRSRMRWSSGSNGGFNQDPPLLLRIASRDRSTTHADQHSAAGFAQPARGARAFGFHMKHRLVFSGTYMLPGRRYVITVAGNCRRSGRCSRERRFRQSSVRTFRVLAARLSIVRTLIRNPNISNATPARFFDPTAFQIPDPGTFGNSGRNVIIGPGIRNIDLTLARRFRLSDSTRVQFRADFYNVFNHPNFVAPPTMQNFADSSDFGALFVARSPRIVQFGLKFLW